MTRTYARTKPYIEERHLIELGSGEILDAGNMFVYRKAENGSLFKVGDYYDRIPQTDKPRAGIVTNGIAKLLASLSKMKPNSQADLGKLTEAHV